jgi:hypothetical protein
MPTMVVCSGCQQKGEYCHTEISLVSRVGQGIEIRGVITCLQDGHQWPVVIDSDAIGQTAPTLAGLSRTTNVPQGIAQDVEEARRAHFMQCYKASVVMCRRAMQRGLIDRGIPDDSLQRMLNKAKTEGTIKDERAYGTASAVKDYGDAGAHRRAELTHDEVGGVILATTLLLNELFGKEGE